jgi:hypothetical protein
MINLEKFHGKIKDIALIYQLMPETPIKGDKMGIVRYEPDAFQSRYLLPG